MSPRKNFSFLVARTTGHGRLDTDSGLCAKRQKRHKSCAFDCAFDLALTAGAIAAALARIYLAAMRQQLLQGLDVLVIHVFLTPPAKPALGLLRRRQLMGVVRPVVSSFASSIVSSFAIFRHIFTFKKLRISSIGYAARFVHRITVACQSTIYATDTSRATATVKLNRLKRYIICGRMRSLYRAASFRLNLTVRPGFTACCSGLSPGSGPAANRSTEKLEVLDDNPVPASLGTVLRRPLLE